MCVLFAWVLWFWLLFAVSGTSSGAPTSVAAPRPAEIERAKRLLDSGAVDPGSSTSPRRAP
jgi:hypothetical protein